MATEEITISELELADEVLADMALPVDTATETRAVTLKQLRAWLGSALPVGSVFASVGRLDDERFTLLDGKTISRIGTYEAFCNKVVEKVQAGTWKACTEEEFNLEVSETGQCGKFVVSNDYVRIPKLGNSLCSGVIDGKIPVVGNETAVGITNGSSYQAFTASGAQGSNYQLVGATTGGYGANIGSSATGTNAFSTGQALGITTDPTKSGIEGKINSVEVFYYMVISTEGQTTKVEIDVNKVYEDLNLKANKDLSDVESVASSFKEASVGWGIPDYSAGISFSTKTYTTPSDGFIFCGVSGNGSQSTTINGNQVAITYNTGVSCSYPQLCLPVSKGDVFKTNAGLNWARFYPLKGVN